MTKARIEALTDGIFATVMTVLVLGLRLPNSNLSEHGLEAEIMGLSPNILAYAFSFVVLGVYWIGHHNQFHYIKSTDRVFLWVNILFLLTIGFVPFSTSLLGGYPFSPTAVRVYGANLAATGLALYAVWWYATSQHRLVDKDLDPHIVSIAKRRTIIGPVVSLLGIGFSFLDTRISLGAVPTSDSVLYPTQPYRHSFQRGLSRLIEVIKTSPTPSWRMRPRPSPSIHSSTIFPRSIGMMLVPRSSGNVLKARCQTVQESPHELD